MNEARAVSPLTGKEVPAHNPIETEKGLPQMFRFEHTQDGFDDFRMGVSVLSRLGHNTPQYCYEEWRRDVHRILERRFHTPTDTGAALNLIRGYLWRTHHRRKFSPNEKYLLVTTADDHNEIVDVLEASDNLSYFVAKPFEEFISEARSLTLVSKALFTLENLYLFWQEQGLNKPLAIPYSAVDGSQNAFFRSNSGDPDENGMCYGASKLTAPLIYEFLLEEGYLRQRKSGGSFGGFYISSKGVAEIDRLRVGKSQVRQGFLVRRYDEELDKFLRPVMAEVAQRLNCPIQAVWEQDHNDRIDERLFRLIRESSVVVVDVSTDVGSNPDRINVGLELGYALALQKPVVVIRQKPKQDAEHWKRTLPFDIITTNCYDYEINDFGWEALVEKLVARVGLALDLQM